MMASMRSPQVRGERPAGQRHQQQPGKQQPDHDDHAERDDGGPPWPHAEIDHEDRPDHQADDRSEEHTSELQSLMRISYAVFCLNHKLNTRITTSTIKKK